MTEPDVLLPVDAARPERALETQEGLGQHARPEPLDGLCVALGQPRLELDPPCPKDTQGNRHHDRTGRGPTGGRVDVHAVSAQHHTADLHTMRHVESSRQVVDNLAEASGKEHVLPRGPELPTVLDGERRELVGVRPPLGHEGRVEVER